ncbi:MAG: hypothetical protein WAO12_10205 [Venatoribacter sp.]
MDEESIFIAFELSSNNFNIKNLKNGDIPLGKKPAKNSFKRRVVYFIARFINSYILLNHKNTLAIFSSAEVLRPTEKNNHEYSYIVFCQNIFIPLEIKKDIEMAAFKFCLSLAESNAFSQSDFFNGDPRGELLEKINIDFEETHDLTREFLNKNGGKSLGKDTFVSSENFSTPLALRSKIKSPVIKNISQNKTIYSSMAQYEIIDFKKNTIKIYFYNKKENKIKTKGNILHFDEGLKNQLIKSISISGFFNIEYIKETIGDNYSEKLVVLNFSVSDGPGGLLA